jgi:hypothetical protein
MRGSPWNTRNTLNMELAMLETVSASPCTRSWLAPAKLASIAVNYPSGSSLNWHLIRTLRYNSLKNLGRLINESVWLGKLSNHFFDECSYESRSRGIQKLHSVIH